MLAAGRLCLEQPGSPVRQLPQAWWQAASVGPLLRSVITDAWDRGTPADSDTPTPRGEDRLRGWHLALPAALIKLVL